MRCSDVKLAARVWAWRRGKGREGYEGGSPAALCRAGRRAGGPGVAGMRQCLIPQRELCMAHVLGYRITESECSGLEGSSVGHLVQPPCRSRVTYSRLHRTLSRQVLNISREGDSTTSLGRLFQCSITLRVKKFFFVLSWNFLCFSLCPLPLVLSLDTTEKCLASSS